MAMPPGFSTLYTCSIMTFAAAQNVVPWVLLSWPSAVLYNVAEEPPPAIVPQHRLSRPSISIGRAVREAPLWSVSSYVGDPIAQSICPHCPLLLPYATWRTAPPWICSGCGSAPPVGVPPSASNGVPGERLPRFAGALP